MSNSWQDEYQTMICDCEIRHYKLNDWESGFIQSLGEQLDNGKTLSGPQIEKLEAIWERVTSNG